MVLAVVQSKQGLWGGGTQTVTFTSTPTNGNTMVGMLFGEGGTPTITTSGWTLLQDGSCDAGDKRLRIYTKVAGAAEPSAVATDAGSGGLVKALHIFEVSGAVDSSGVVSNAGTTTPLTGPTLTPSANPGIILAAFYGSTKTYTGPAVFTPTAPLTLAYFERHSPGRGHAWSGTMATTTGAYTPTLGQTGLDYGQTIRIAVALVGSAPTIPVANFTGTPLTGSAPLSVVFTDTSTNTPTSWLWDFGDGSTSTTQHPTHNFVSAGTYSVTLTATNASGSGSVTKTAYVVAAVAAEAGIFVDWDLDGFSTTVTGGGLTRLMPSSASGAADNITADVTAVSWRRGASLDHVSPAGPGGGVITVKNGSNAAEPDKYNPDNTASSLYGKLLPGRPIWGGAIRTTAALSGSGTVRGFMAGRITEIVPMPVPGGNPTADILWEDALGWYRRATASVGPETTRSQAEFRSDILEAVGEDLTRLDLDTESGMVPFSAADTREALGLLEDLNRATTTRHWVAPADTKEDWYDYSTAGRTYKLASTADADINADDVTELSGYRVTNDTIVNEQRATVSPIAFSSINETQWTNGQVPLTVTTAVNVVIWADFEDYVFDAAAVANSTGGTLTTTLTNFGKAAKLELSATGSAAVITSLYITGRILRHLDNETVVSENEASQLIYGTQSGSDITSDFIGQTGAAKGVTDFLIWKFANPLKRPTITIAGKGALTWNYILDLDLYDIVTLTVDRLQVVSKRFEIIGLSGSIEPGAFWQVSFELQETPNQSPVTYFTVDTDLANGAALIAPF